MAMPEKPKGVELMALNLWRGISAIFLVAGVAGFFLALKYAPYLACVVSLLINLSISKNHQNHTENSRPH